jgi:hypothetical protein
MKDIARMYKAWTFRAIHQGRKLQAQIFLNEKSDAPHILD